MADGFSFEEAQQPGASPAKGGFSFEDAVGKGGSSTPETDAALNETFPEQMHRVFGSITQSMPAWMRQRAAAAGTAQVPSTFVRLLKAPSPAWMQPFERSVREVATTAPQIPVTPESSGPRRLAAAIINPLAGYATLENAALGAAYVTQPEIAAALIAAKMAPAVAPWWQKFKQLPQMTPEQGLRFGMETWPLLAAPFFHGPKPSFEPVSPRPGAVYPELPFKADEPPPTVPPAPIPTAPEAPRGAPPITMEELKERMEEPAAAAPVAETEPQAKARLQAVDDRLAIYGVEPADTTGLTTGEAADLLEAQENEFPYVERHVSIRTGKTLQENRIARQIRQQYLEQASGRFGRTDVNRSGTIPLFDVREEPTGGFRVRVSPSEEIVEIPPMTPKGRPTYQKRTVPGADLFLDREGGELQPYAQRRSDAQIQARPAAQRVETRPQGEVPEAGDSDYVERAAEGAAAGRPLPSEPVSGTAPVVPEVPPPAPRYRLDETEKGAVIRDLETDKVVRSFQSSELHPTVGELADFREEARDILEQLNRKAAGKPQRISVRPHIETTTRPLGVGPRTLEQEMANAAELGMTLEDYRAMNENPLTHPGPPDRPAPPPSPVQRVAASAPRRGKVQEAVKEAIKEGEPGKEEEVPIAPVGKPKGRIWQRIGVKPMRYQHRDNPNLRLEQNPEKGGYDVVALSKGQREVLKNYPDRGQAQAAYEHGRAERPPEEEVTEPGFDDVSDFENAVEERFNRKVTEPERQKFQSFANQVKTAKADAAKAASSAVKGVLEHWKNVKDIPFEDALKQIQDAIDEALRPCDI